MEKIKKSINKNLPPLILYLDDIRKIFDFLKGTTKENVFIETCGYRLNSPDELSNLDKEKTNSLAIDYFESPFKYDNAHYVRLYLNQNNGSIVIDKEDVVAQGIAASIEKILLPHKKSIVFRTVSNVLFVCFVIIVVLTVQFTRYNNYAIYALIGLACSGLFHWLRLNRWYNTIYFKSRKETPSFLKRNKDAIIVAIVAGVIVAIISSYVTVIITKIFSTAGSNIGSNSSKPTVQNGVNGH